MKHLLLATALFATPVHAERLPFTAAEILNMFQAHDEPKIAFVEGFVMATLETYKSAASKELLNMHDFCLPEIPDAEIVFGVIGNVNLTLARSPKFRAFDATAAIIGAATVVYPCTNS